MKYISRFKNRYEEGGLLNALYYVANYYNLPTQRYLKYIDKHGIRHGIPLATAENLFELLPDDHSGVNVFEFDWDILIVLDTCRPEWTREIRTEYDFINDQKTIRSVGGRTSEWTARTFRRTNLSQRPIKYIYGSKYGNKSEDFQNVDGEFIRSERYRYPPAHKITDYAEYFIKNERKQERVIVHYAQPHYPVFRTNGSRDDVKIVSEGGIMKDFASGKSLDEIEDLHKMNLRYVMDEIEGFVEGLNEYDIMITADHGQSLGEYFIIGHPYGLRHDAVREVPLISVQ